MLRWQRPLGWLSIIFGTLSAVSVALWLCWGAADSGPAVVVGMLLRVGLAVVLLWQGWRFLRPESRNQR